LARPQGQPWRIGIWGDSHIAAAFWSDALSRQIAPALSGAAAQLYPGNFLRAGVRHPGLKRVCLEGAWRYESAHAQHLAQSMPGPGLVSMHTQELGSSLEVDVRGAGQTAAPQAWRWLLQNQDVGQPLKVAFSADGGPEQVMLLPASEQALVVHVQSQLPLSRLRLRLISGHLRLQGLVASSPPNLVADQLRMDVFGYPGATLAGWQMVDMDRLMSWKQEWGDYDVVVLAYGTNEGNVRPFQAGAYRQLLEQALRNLRRAFPASACLLVGPGDRGVLIRRSQKRAAVTAKTLTRQQQATKKTAKQTVPAKPAALGEAQLLAFSHVHAQINRIQKELGAAHGCVAWSAQEAMGGLGSAYRWGLQKPPLMARDLIHFTGAGYQELAKRLAKDMGWAE
jgi:lysophospholipase L1-like esterase